MIVAMAGRTFIHSCGNCDAMCDDRSWKNLLVGYDRWERTVQVIDFPDELLPAFAFEMEYQAQVAELRKDLEDK